MSLKTTLYKMFESNEGGSLSCARVMTWTCGGIGMILLILHFLPLSLYSQKSPTIMIFAFEQLFFT